MAINPAVFAAQNQSPVRAQPTNHERQEREEELLRAPKRARVQQVAQGHFQGRNLLGRFNQAGN